MKHGMALSRTLIAMVLPLREGFGPQSAGAIAMVARCHAEASPHAVVVLGGAQSCATYSGLEFRGLASRSPWHYGLRVIKDLLKRSPTVVEVHQQPRLALILATLMPRTRVMLFLHNDPLSMRGLRGIAARQRLLHRLHRVICVSDYLRERYRSGMTGESSILVSLHNPLNIKNLPSQFIKADQILYAGRIVADKGVADFIGACRQILPALPGWTARIIGGDRFGPKSPETAFFRAMRDAAKEAGIRFDGPQPHDFVLQAMAGAAIAVVPSRWPEPFGMTALEAMASGAALIAARAGGLPEVAGNAAWYFPPGDTAALSNAIRDLALDRRLRDALVKSGLARAALFDAPVIAKKLQALREPFPAL